MAFEPTKFGRISAGGNSNVAQIFGYATNDTLATVVGSNYFGDAVGVAATGLKVMDVIECRYDEDGTPGHARLIVTSTAAGAVAVSQQALDNSVWITTTMTDVSTAGSVYIAAPFAGTIRRFKTVLQGAISGANSVVHLELGGSTDVTGATVTVAYSSSAAGDVDEATATAANAVTAGQAVEIATDGASSDTAALVCMVEFIPTYQTANNVWVCGTFPDISTAGSYYVAAPFAGTIGRWKTVLQSVTSFGATDCNLKLQLANVDVTGSDIVVSGTGEAVGDVDEATCTAANTVTAGQAIEIVSDGASSGTIPAFFMIEIVPS